MENYIQDPVINYNGKEKRAYRIITQETANNE